MFNSKLLSLRLAKCHLKMTFAWFIRCRTTQSTGSVYIFSLTVENAIINVATHEMLEETELVLM